MGASSYHRGDGGFMSSYAASVTQCGGLARTHTLTLSLSLALCLHALSFFSLSLLNDTRTMRWHELLDDRIYFLR